jgi:hypothetical protein
MPSRWTNRIAAAALLLTASPIAAPQLLAFPYSTQIGRHRVYSEVPIDPRLTAIVARADMLASRSPLASGQALNQPIFLTNGGWRWTWLALQNRGAFALSRPLIETLIVNRSDIASDSVENGQPIAGHRSLDGTLTHEMTHGLIRAHFGALADSRYPAELREGYCDYVAGGGSLTDAQAHALITSRREVPALTYWRGRKKVEAALAANHGNVEAMFANWRS